MPGPDARVAGEDGEDEREAVAVDAVDDAPRRDRAPTGETSAWTSTSSGRVPSIAASTTLPGARVASPTKRAEASATSTRPAGPISKTPTSLVEPKRFFSARSVR